MMQDFVIEATELFDEAEDALLDLEKGESFKDCFNAIFRAFHSVKGAAGMFEIDALQKHMHHLENLLSDKKSHNTLSKPMIDYLFLGVDSARQILEGKQPSFKYHDPDQSEQTTPTRLEPAEKDKAKKVKPRGVVWMVDDEEDILDMLQFTLQEEGYETRTYLSAKKLLGTLEDQSPDLIISDINMPEMNGTELVKAVNKKKPHLPVIILSGYVTKDVCLQVLSQGVSGIIEKPHKNEMLLAQVALNVNRFQNLKLLNKSIDLLIYQFENLGKLVSEENQSYVDVYKSELKNILLKKKELYNRLL